MDDISKLYADYLALPENKKKSGISFSGVEILRIGPSSVVFADANRVIKIVVPNEENKKIVTSVEEEFKALERFKAFQRNSFITPTAIEWGKNPDYLVMSRLGKSFERTSDQEYRQAGAAIGEFAARLWMERRSIHADIYYDNFTRELDGKIGILDFSAVRKAEFPEEMFWTPLQYQPSAAVEIALAFTEKTGVAIDFKRVGRLVENFLPNCLAACKENLNYDLRERIESNLQELGEALRCQRPPRVFNETRIDVRNG